MADFEFDCLCKGSKALEDQGRPNTLTFKWLVQVFSAAFPNHYMSVITAALYHYLHGFHGFNMIS